VRRGRDCPKIMWEDASVKIVHLGPSVLPISYPLGGAVQRRMLEMAKAQSVRGEKVIIYSADSESGRTNCDGVEIRSIACRRRMPFRDFEYLRKALEELRCESVDVLHFHNLPEGAAFSKAIRAEKLLSFDYFVFRRGKKTPVFWWYRNALRQFSWLLPVSEYCLRGYKSYWGSNGVPIRILHNGVNLEQFSSDPASGLARKRALGIEKERVILYVGRVCRQKGIDILIDAFQHLRQRVANVSLVVAGPAEQFENKGHTELTRRISEVGGLYLGPVQEKDLAATYNLCDVFVMPTRSIEMFGMAALEAQACGKPVVCSQHGGLPEVISPKSGLFFPVGNAEALADSLSQLFQNTDLYRSKAEAARPNALRFAWPRIIEDLETAYRGCWEPQNAAALVSAL
jgi:glycosyltransferase involved in cell wall biosynthesis